MGAIDKETKPKAPQALTKDHILDDFDCGVASLNDWLKNRALKNEHEGSSRTYVVCVANNVIAYYAIAAGAVRREDAPGNIRRNMPDPIPVMVLGRLAVDLRWQHKGLGGDILSNAIKRTLQASSIVGSRAFVVHVLSENAKRFYEHYGFRPSPTNQMDLMISLKEAEATLFTDT
ncbi:MAG: GNAT family N-acetyltransferase [Candidatus Anammoxibacter sp.]